MKINKYNSSISQPQISPQDIYNGGGFKPIATKDLLNNETAIDQLLNDHNQKSQKIEELQTGIGSLRSSLEFQRASPFVSILSAIINVLGTCVVAYGVNLCTMFEPIKGGYILVVIGSVLVVLSNTAVILYP